MATFKWTRKTTIVEPVVIEPTFCGVSKEQAKTLATTGVIVGASTAIGAGATMLVAGGVGSIMSWINDKIQAAYESGAEARAERAEAKAQAKKEKELAGKK